MRENRVAIVGDGVASLIALAVLRHAGLPHGEVAVYGDGPHPLVHLERYARSVGQHTMRSEGDGHLDPRNFPDLALIHAWRSRSLRPLIATLFNAYNPPLDVLLHHSAGVARRYDFEAHRVVARIGCVRRAEDASGFELYDEAWRLVAHARHVVLALGHPGLYWPPELESLRTHPRVVHVYQQPTFQPGERVVIVGGGIGAAHVWQTALGAGAEVVALHRRPLRHQALNAPRCDFSAIGINAYRRLASRERLGWLQSDLGSSYPFRPRWEWRLWRARRAGRFSTRHAAIVRIASGSTDDDPLVLWLDDRTALESDQLVLATGFETDARAHALIRQMDEESGLPTVDGLLQIDDDFTLPPLSRRDSMCAVIGALARWALPVSDTFAGMKYVARRIAPLLMQDNAHVLHLRR